MNEECLLEVLKLFNIKETINKNKKNTDMCSSFLAYWNDRYRRVGNNHIWIYMTFQFNYWKELKSQFFSIAQWIGSKAIEKWEERNQEFDWILTEPIPISKKTYIFILNKHGFIKKEEKGFDIEEQLRKDRLNTEEGLIYCETFTTLYSETSKSCSECRFQAKCIEVKKSNLKNGKEKRS